MSTEAAMLLSAAVGVGASLLTLFITRIFDARSERRRERERFFYEMYGRRLALYRKILKQIHLFSDITFPGTHDLPAKTAIIITSFVELADMSGLVASLAVADSLKQISEFICHWTEVRRKAGRSDRETEALVSFLAEQGALLQNRIREETCPALVDEYLFEITGSGFRHRKPPC
jgi:hypothetical protein